MDKHYQGLINYRRGEQFEQMVIEGCETYAIYDRAFIQKTPEAFKVKRQIKSGEFIGFFKSKAQPDFKGVLSGGQAIVFETKYTNLNKLKLSVLTKEQDACLEKSYQMGAVTGVLIGIKDQYFFIPWRFWRVMKEQYDRAVIKPEAVQAYRVKFNGTVKFLDLASGKKIENMEIYKKELDF